MKNFKHFAVAFSMLLVAFLMTAGQAVAQGDAMNNVKQAMKAGSAKDLSRNFGNMVEITLDGAEATSYSSTQAEFVMKNFFSKNAPVDFSVNHNGTSDKGQLYAIGTYSSKGGSYTVLIRMKSSGDKYLIHSMNFIKD
ncbi:DUF4783 domain-containing protein [Pontibacter anaerobius]|uniref:DUF4783 domain-containing protein n=1 Tax=Pontibacter anaerobius TaxID=2993940 RepID=A0ABT3RGU4_9BACT|nr:DUF4783 domain-containing protein [Pontibacter anaerobius]MCX2740634.1 DUF4783 domain-containing protein [Pontibacter anaerobius]